MDKMVLVLFLILINSYIITEKKKHPEKWEKHDKKSKIIWSIFSIAFTVVMLVVIWYIFFKSNVDMFSKVFYLLSIAMFVGFLAFQTISLWKNKK